MKSMSLLAIVMVMGGSEGASTCASMVDLWQRGGEGEPVMMVHEKGTSEQMKAGDSCDRLLFAERARDKHMSSSKCSDSVFTLQRS